MTEDLPIIFSRHALIKLEQRNLTRDMVIHTIEYPSRLETVGGQMHAFKKFKRLYLKVIFVRTENEIIVITQYIVKKIL